MFLYYTCMCNVHCCRWYKFNIKEFLYNTQYFYIVDHDEELNNNNNNNNTKMHLVVSTATLLANASHCYVLNSGCAIYLVSFHKVL